MDKECRHNYEQYVTTYRYIGFNYESKKWRSREALAKHIRKQELRGHSSDDWTPCVSLKPNEGF